MTDRGEGEIRMDASMWALVAELESLKTKRSAMEATNEGRRVGNDVPAYDEREFRDLAEEMYRVSLDLATKI